MSVTPGRHSGRAASAARAGIHIPGACLIDQWLWIPALAALGRDDAVWRALLKQIFQQTVFGPRLARVGGTKSPQFPISFRLLRSRHGDIGGCDAEFILLSTSGGYVLAVQGLMHRPALGRSISSHGGRLDREGPRRRDRRFQQKLSADQHPRSAAGRELGRVLIKLARSSRRPHKSKKRGDMGGRRSTV
jgi:hypothetical protein